MPRLSGFPCAPGTDPGKLQKSPKETVERTKVTPKRRGGSSRGSFGSYGAAKRAGRLHSPSEVRGARAKGWRREGRRLDAGEDAAEEGAAPGF